MDNWQDKSTFICETCLCFVPKDGNIGRCRRHAPTLDGWPPVYNDDWCYDHKINGEAVPDNPIISSWCVDDMVDFDPNKDKDRDFTVPDLILTGRIKEIISTGETMYYKILCGRDEYVVPEESIEGIC